jgi:biotin carboxyl carrier protein
MTGPLRVVPIGATGTAVDAEACDLDPADPAAPGLADVGHGLIRITAPSGEDDDRLGVVARLPATVAGGADRYEVVVDGWRFELEVEAASRARLRRRATRSTDAATASGPADIRAIIPGRIAAVRVTAGETVEAGQTLLVVEAMKMQNELRAPRAGTIERVAVGAGQTIDRGDLLVVLR